MRKLSIALLAALLLVFATPGLHAQAALYPPCGDQQPPNSPTGTCRPMYIGGELVTLKAGVPFAWLRNAPQSPQVIATVWPGANPTMQIVHGQPGYFDGFQWWWQVLLYPYPPYATGWVEQASLVGVAQVPDDDPAVMKPWQVPMPAQVKAGIPFVWVRLAPSSYAAPTYTISPLGRFLVVGSPSFDGLQWWWLVSVQTPYGPVYGYVEQASILSLTI